MHTFADGPVRILVVFLTGQMFLAKKYVTIYSNIMIQFLGPWLNNKKFFRGISFTNVIICLPRKYDVQMPKIPSLFYLGKYE